MQSPKAIFITGASSGIGMALARHYAAPGVQLALSGRDAARLQAVAQDCAARGAETLILPADVTDRDAMTSIVARADDWAALDLVVANAGVSFHSKDFNEMGEMVARTFAVNVDGVFNTIHPALARMQARRRGQIAIISSLAGFRGLPSQPPYSASKAAVKAYGAGLRGQIKPHGVQVNVVCPGFIRTPMTADNPFPMPFIMDADRAARIIARGLARNQGLIAFPWPLAFLLACVLRLPEAWQQAIVEALPAK